ncbi:MAG: hypothetical protein WC509_05685 [Candidatus Izemoplasmatales bacterium]
MIRDSKTNGDKNSFYRFHYWRETILGLIGAFGGILILVFRALWENTLVLILVLWGFVMALVLAWLVMRAVQKKQERKIAHRSDPTADAWRMPPTGRK